MASDSFVVRPPSTEFDYVIYGKNSDRPPTEVQEVIYVNNVISEPKSKVQCSYIEVDQVPRTLAVVLSKPAWSWGAEMGANEKGVSIGSIATWTKLCCPEDLQTERLTGMDLVRLGLERARSSRDALKVVTKLFDQYGVGGPCFEDPDLQDFVHHNSFLITDKTESWILETAGKCWAAEKVTAGVRNVSNKLTIGTKIDERSAGLEEYAKENKLWTGEGEFNFAESFQAPTPELPFVVPEKSFPENRYECGKTLLENITNEGLFRMSNMFGILRNEASGINSKIPSLTTSSQVSVLSPSGAAVHFFTAIPDPSVAVYKPFVFSKDTIFGKATISPTFGNKDPAKKTPRFQKDVNRKHPLYSARGNHVMKAGKISQDEQREITSNLKELEEQVLKDMSEYLENPKSIAEESISCIYKTISESEILIYNATCLVDPKDLANLDFNLDTGML